MALNYLPSAKFVALTQLVHRQAPTKVDMSFGGGRTVLHDLAVYVPYFDRLAAADYSGCSFMRVGKFGQGYLTQDFYPLGCYNTKVYQNTGVWNFARPYRLFPGEKVTAEYKIALSPAPYDSYARVPAIMMNGVRVTDNRPIVLYSGNGQALTNNYTVRLNAETLQCPFDSPVDVHSITMMYTSTRGDQLQVMVYGPDGRRWVDNPKVPWFSRPNGILYDLNKPQWVMEPGESFCCEFITNSSGLVNLYLLLRGQIEVTV